MGEGDRWIDIDLSHQTLVAYDWKQPRYVTLVSSGRARTPRPELDYLTPRGLHRIRGKHLTATMDDDEPGEPPYSLEDVPYADDGNPESGWIYGDWSKLRLFNPEKDPTFAR